MQRDLHCKEIIKIETINFLNKNYSVHYNISESQYSIYISTTLWELFIEETNQSINQSF